MRTSAVKPGPVMNQRITLRPCEGTGKYVTHLERQQGPNYWAKTCPEHFTSLYLALKSFRTRSRRLLK